MIDPLNATVCDVIDELTRQYEKHGNVRIDSFFEGCTGGINIHYEPEHPPTAVAWSDGTPILYARDGKPETIYIGERYYE
jgi:hypothetical protein